MNKFEYLRLSIINKCNLRCLYCKPREYTIRTEKRYITPQDVEIILKFFTRLGTKKLRITGGEPLLREDIYDIIRIAYSFPDIKEIGLTTNGILLADKITLLSSVGLKRINISLPSLKEERYENITGTKIQYVLNGIDAALRLSMRVKLNMVAYREDILDEIEQTIDFIANREVELRFIEYMPVCSRNYRSVDFVPLPIVEHILKHKYGFVPNELNNQIVSRVYFRNDIKGRIGFIRPVTNPFCNLCNKVRINCYGLLTPCLFSDKFINIIKILKNYNSQESIISRLNKFMNQNDIKPDINSLFEGKIISSKTMAEIGG